MFKPSPLALEQEKNAPEALIHQPHIEPNINATKKNADIAQNKIAVKLSPRPLWVLENTRRNFDFQFENRDSTSPFGAIEIFVVLWVFSTGSRRTSTVHGIISVV